MLFRILLVILCFTSSVWSNEASQSKVIICGIGKDIAVALKNTIINIEELGGHFADYRVIIYENNSSDQTPLILKKWANKNSKVTAVCESLSSKELPPTRIERIAFARNKVLSIARGSEYEGFDYLIVADLDFQTPWPIEAILETFDTPIAWDCVTANGIRGKNYWDRYAFRDKEFPFGPEIFGNEYWNDLSDTWFRLKGDQWRPVFSAFGGLAIYRMNSIINFSYSATPTHDLEVFYHQILSSLPTTHYYRRKYLHLLEMDFQHPSNVPILFQTDRLAEDSVIPICCEHVGLHASMVVNGFDKIYINPKMVMKY